MVDDLFKVGILALCAQYYHQRAALVTAVPGRQEVIAKALRADIDGR
jgi:hypothetical protein